MWKWNMNDDTKKQDSAFGEGQEMYFARFLFILNSILYMSVGIYCGSLGYTANILFL